MAVYTHVPAEDIDAFLARYDAGRLVSAKGIAEGVENSNYLLETTGADGHGHRYILTLYEKRVDEADLPFFMDLLDHLGARGCQVPRFIADREGRRLQQLSGRPACLIEFLTGISVTEPTPGQARAAGVALGELHKAAQGFAGERRNALDKDGWHALAARCGDDFDEIQPGLAARVAQELAFLDAHWPADLPRSVIHADLFPDNVLMLGEEVTGLIDFYFSCTDIRAYDLAVTHSAWVFSNDGATWFGDRAAALGAGYARSHGLTEAERAAFPILCRGAALRFLLTRAYDWINTPADALVTRKDPLAYLRRLDFYAKADPAELLGA
ncbi:MAG TPA: homoserine kinase [Sphingobium sp.]|jgi:homoserine kinase type II|uniref:homoserine kinase n=1 Tax=unclassified Sphingobium TaxID=2611147 RepID=UPI000EDA5C35|nr:MULTISPECIES: homoserine kinase [unclassified Sphingobium]WIW87359.1 homoserine kinase [Sphingobium sp. V4]HAF42371.1 homoserine kinase [Sphingobium sp.]